MSSRIVLCEWYAHCYKVAEWSVWHPILGRVPTCDRCVKRHDMQADARPLNCE